MKIKMSLETKLFILGLILASAWIAAMFSGLNATYTDNIGKALMFIIGAFISAYKRK